jgi:toluene monooxygenase system ferredoxin subunit
VTAGADAFGDYERGESLTWQRLCAAGDVEENSLKKMEIEGVAVLVTSVGGTVVAFPPLCPHMAEPLVMSGVCDGQSLTCTKHVWQWDLSTGEPQGLAEKPLLFYPTRREGDEILIDFSGELTYDYD